MIRCVAFDFDGTLVDSNPLKKQAYFDAAAAVGIAAACVREAIAAQPGADRFGVMRDVAARAVAAGLGENPERLAQRLIDAYASMCEHGQATLPERSGASSTLDALATLPLYVNSATPADSLARAIDRRGWAPRFRAVLGRPASKAENLAQVLAREAIAPSELVMVGDERRDHDAAAAIGCGFIGVRSVGGDLPEHDAPLPDLVGLTALIQAMR